MCLLLGVDLMQTQEDNFCAGLYNALLVASTYSLFGWRLCAGAAVGCRYVWVSLLPIVGGCSLSAMKELSFSWGGFNSAMISNLGMVLRNIYSKKSLNDYKVRQKLCTVLGF